MKIRLLFILPILLVSSMVVGHATDTVSPAVNAGDFLYVTGQLPIDPVTGEMIQGDMETLTNQAIDNLKHILHVKGYKMKQVVKTVVYLSDIRDYDAMDFAYGERFTSNFPPAREVAAVSQLPNNARIEISCVAYKKR